MSPPTGHRNGVGPDDPRPRLLDEQRRTRARLARLRGDHDGFVAASQDSNADDEHDPEGATIAFERAQVEALTRQTQTRLTEVAAALARIEAGDYGTCERCGHPIPRARLEARPTAACCIGCASTPTR